MYYIIESLFIASPTKIRFYVHLRGRGTRRRAWWSLWKESTDSLYLGLEKPKIFEATIFLLKLRPEVFTHFLKLKFRGGSTSSAFSTSRLQHSFLRFRSVFYCGTLIMETMFILHSFIGNFIVQYSNALNTILLINFSLFFYLLKQFLRTFIMHYFVIIIINIVIQCMYKFMCKRHYLLLLFIHNTLMKKKMNKPSLIHVVKLLLPKENWSK